MFAPEGYGIIGGAAILSIALAFTGYWFGGWWMVLLGCLAVLLMAFTLYFFRDPERTPPPDAKGGNLILSPADGKVVEVAEEDEPRFLKSRARRISVFLSPLNVHVNRVPADGKITYVDYFPGEYLVAWHPKASEKNERSEIGLVHPSGEKILFKQIAGAVARRIVYHLKEGDEVKAGDRFGVVKFGSRMDILLPLHVEVDVEKDQRVVAGETILGRFVQEATDSDASSTVTQSAES